jgi:hypothetical protein
MVEVGRHQLGSGVRSYEAWTPVQGQRLREAVSEGRFRTIGEAMAWCEKEVGVKVSYEELYYWFRRQGYRRRVPQPMAGKADGQAREGWRRGGLLAGLIPFAIKNFLNGGRFLAAASPAGWPPPQHGAAARRRRAAGPQNTTNSHSESLCTELVLESEASF